MDMKSGDTFEVPMGGKPPMEAATATKVGFRELSSEEAQDVRDCRELGAHCERILAQLTRHGGDARNLAIAKTAFEDGLMRAVRAVTKPAFF